MFTVMNPLYWLGVMKYLQDFEKPSEKAREMFLSTQKRKAGRFSPWEDVASYSQLMEANLELAKKCTASSYLESLKYHLNENNDFFSAMLNTMWGLKGENIWQFARRKDQVLEMAVNDYPKAIREIKSEYGFHFEQEDRYVKAGETDRFLLYQVLPWDPQVKVLENGKPVVIIPPYVLGANILAFLPGENKSYAHCFANQGIPTYIRIMKDIETNEAVQLMTPEDDILDTRKFCIRVMSKHRRQVTLNGFCQGGYMTTLAMLSGELDGYADTHITCVTPIDGSRSVALVDYMESMPKRFQDLGYSLKILPNGIPVVDGDILSWVFKLKSIERDGPISTFYRDLAMFDKPGQVPKINKTAAAINHWMLYDKTDLPQAITQASYDSYTIPITEDGTLPVEVFGRKLNLKRFKERGVPWLICIAEKDDLVDEAASLAPLDWVDAEVTVFPKGHTAMATSWSAPTSECALDACFNHPSSSRSNGTCRGPVRYQLDLDS